MKFTIRDIVWLTILVAVAVTWWLDHRTSGRKCEQLREHAQLLQYQVQVERALREAVEAMVAAEREVAEAQAHDMASEVKAAMEELAKPKP